MKIVYKPTGTVMSVDDARGEQLLAMSSSWVRQDEKAKPVKQAKPVPATDAAGEEAA